MPKVQYSKDDQLITTIKEMPEIIRGISCPGNIASGVQLLTQHDDINMGGECFDEMDGASPTTKQAIASIQLSQAPDKILSVINCPIPGMTMICSRNAGISSPLSKTAIKEISIYQKDMCCLSDYMNSVIADAGASDFLYGDSAFNALNLVANRLNDQAIATINQLQTLAVKLIITLAKINILSNELIKEHSQMTALYTICQSAKEENIRPVALISLFHDHILRTNIIYSIK